MTTKTTYGNAVQQTACCGLPVVGVVSVVVKQINIVVKQ